MGKKLSGITAPDFEMWFIGAHRILNLPTPADLAVSVGYRTLKLLTVAELTDALAAIVAEGRKLAYGEALATVLLQAHKWLKEGCAEFSMGPCSQGCSKGAFYLLSPEGRAGVELCVHCHPKEKRSVSRADVERLKAEGWQELTDFEYAHACAYGARYLAMRPMLQARYAGRQ